MSIHPQQFPSEIWALILQYLDKRDAIALFETSKVVYSSLSQPQYLLIRQEYKTLIRHFPSYHPFIEYLKHSMKSSDGRNLLFCAAEFDREQLFEIISRAMIISVRDNAFKALFREILDYDLNHSETFKKYAQLIMWHWRHDEQLVSFARNQIISTILSIEDMDQRHYRQEKNGHNSILLILNDLLYFNLQWKSDNENEALSLAAAIGNWTAVDRILTNESVNPSVNPWEEDPFIPLFYRFPLPLVNAARNGHLDVVDRLLQEPRVDPRAMDNFAIRVASQNGHADVVDRLLLDPRVDRSVVSISGLCARGHLDIVRRLLSDPSIDPSAENNAAICKASVNGYSDLVQLLLEDGRVDPSVNNNYAIRLASEKGHVRVVECLLADSRVDPSADDNYAIRLASASGHLDVVKVLLQDPRTDPSASENGAVSLASSNGHLEVVKYLLNDPRVDPSDSDNYALRMAAESGHVEVVAILLGDARVDPSEQNNYALRAAYKKKYFNVVELLLKHGRVVNSWGDEEMADLSTEELETE